jgi:hypothetical protein
MKFVDGWKAILFGSWTVRLTVLSALLSGAEFAISFLPQNAMSGKMALIAFVVSMAAAVARLVVQPKLRAALFPDSKGDTVPEENHRAT